MRKDAEEHSPSTTPWPCEALDLRKTVSCENSLAAAARVRKQASLGSRLLVLGSIHVSTARRAYVTPKHRSPGEGWAFPQYARFPREVVEQVARGHGFAHRDQHHCTFSDHPVKYAILRFDRSGIWAGRSFSLWKRTGMFP